MNFMWTWFNTDNFDKMGQHWQTSELYECLKDIIKLTMIYWNGYADTLAEWKSTGLIKVWNEIDIKKIQNDSDGMNEYIDEEQVKVYIGKSSDDNYDDKQFCRIFHFYDADEWSTVQYKLPRGITHILTWKPSRWKCGYVPNDIGLLSDGTSSEEISNSDETDSIQTQESSAAMEHTQESEECTVTELALAARTKGHNVADKTSQNGNETKEYKYIRTHC